MLTPAGASLSDALVRACSSDLIEGLSVDFVVERKVRAKRSH